MANNQAAWGLFTGHQAGPEEMMLEGARHFTALKNTTLLSPDVIADAALFFNYHAARAITGVVLPVDAGRLILTGHNHAPVHG